MKSLIFIVALFIGCSDSIDSSLQKVTDFSIVGKWKVESTTKIGDFEEWMNSDGDSVMSLMSFLGPQAIHESPGKTIEFTKDNRIKSNLVDQEMLESLQFGYLIYPKDNLLFFTAISPKDSSMFEMPTIIKFDSDMMIWNLDNLIALKLIKIK